MSHTRLPWAKEGHLVVEDSRVKAICDTEVSWDLSPKRYVDILECEANRQFILRACNNHYKLLDACKVLIEALETERKVQGNGALVYGGEGAVNFGYQAIAQAAAE